MGKGARSADGDGVEAGLLDGTSWTLEGISGGVDVENGGVSTLGCGSFGGRVGALIGVKGFVEASARGNSDGAY